MTEIRYKNAVVRIHGSVDREQIEAATTTFAKKVIKRKKGKK